MILYPQVFHWSGFGLTDFFLVYPLFIVWRLDKVILCWETDTHIHILFLCLKSILRLDCRDLKWNIMVLNSDSCFFIIICVVLMHCYMSIIFLTKPLQTFDSSHMVDVVYAYVKISVYHMDCNPSGYIQALYRTGEKTTSTVICKPWWRTIIFCKVYRNYFFRCSWKFFCLKS